MHFHSRTSHFLAPLFIAFSSLEVMANSLTSPGFTIDLNTLDPVGSGGGTSTGSQALIDLLSKIASLLLIAVPIIAAVAFVIAGYYYILSGGDSEKASQAKTIIKWNLIAIVIALFSYSIIQFLSYILAGTLS